MRVTTFILIGVLIGMGIFSYRLFSTYEKFVQRQISLTETIEKEILTQSRRGIATTKLPANLFDIKLEIDKTTIIGTDDLNIRVLFTNFGTEATPITMTFTIADTKNNKIREEADTVTVETETVFKKKFSKLKLEPGRYTLILNTLYADSVKDKFRQEFEVKRSKFLGIF